MDGVTYLHWHQWARKSGVKVNYRIDHDDFEARRGSEAATARSSVEAIRMLAEHVEAR